MLARLVASFAAGGFAAWLAVPRRGEIDAAPPTMATLDGQALPLGDPQATLDAAEQVVRDWLAHPVTIATGSKRIGRTRERLGARADWAHLRAMVDQLVDARSVLRRAHARTAPLAPL